MKIIWSPRCMFLHSGCCELSFEYMDTMAHGRFHLRGTGPSSYRTIFIYSCIHIHIYTIFVFRIRSCSFPKTEFLNSKQVEQHPISAQLQFIIIEWSTCNFWSNHTDFRKWIFLSNLVFLYTILCTILYALINYCFDNTILWLFQYIDSTVN